MRIAIICSNYFNIDKKTKKGTEIFSYILINNLVRYAKNKNLDIAAFASGASRLPVKIESIDFNPSSSDKNVILNGKHIIFELALISKAISEQDEFDLYHINIGDGDIVLPFVPFVKKPILITLHHVIDAEFTRRYFSLFKQNKNVFFVSVSNAQRKILPDLNYAATIYHGIDTETFKFNSEGGEKIMWAGRAIPEKGVDIVVEVANRVKREAKLFGITKKEHHGWLQEKVVAKINSNNHHLPISFIADKERSHLVNHFQASKLFLFPVQYEEAFGLVLIESMSCGTPVVAYARGSISEIIKDGETGFIVNPSDRDIRGNWMIKKTGIEGLCEAVEKIYSMPKEEHKKMRENCRKHVEKNFTVKRMVWEYEELYERLLSKS